jgi:putative tricarboxylic transport membrane protein
MNGSDTCTRIGSSLIAALCTITVFESAKAQTYPSRTIEFVGQSSPGGGTDLFMRNITELLKKDMSISQPIIVSNRVGGGGAIAYNYIKSKRGDPHVVMTMSTGGVVNASVRPELDLPLSIFTPLAMFAQDPQVIAVRVESKIHTLKELVEAGKREPDTIAVGLSGTGTGAGRLAFFLLERATGSKFKYVTFKGGGDAVRAVLGGHIETTGENMSEMLQLVEAKKMRVLAVVGERRFVQAPDIPTAKELGYNVVAATGRGFGMPAAVPKEAAATMEAALKRVYDSPAYQDYSHRNMFDNNYLDSAAFAKYLAEQRVIQEEFLRALGVVK